jgi:peptidyl-prolyl cis-trans isomerase SurA
MKAVKLLPRLGWLTAAALVLSLGLPVAARAQIVVIANGSPITEFDIQQRTRLLASSGNKNPSRKDVINELIDDRIKISRAKDYGLSVSNDDVDAGFRNMATRQHVTPEQFTQALERSGLTPGAIKDRIRAEMTWTQLVRGVAGQSLVVNDADIANALKPGENANTTVAYLYTLYPIIVVAPQGTSEATLRTKRNEAENLRSRFQNCKQGLVLARGLRDVAIREPISRNAAELPEPQREILGKMEIGHLTQPEVTAQGFQMFAVCAKTQTKADSPAVRTKRDELFKQRYETESKRLLDKLRKQALIVYK